MAQNNEKGVFITNDSFIDIVQTINTILNKQDTSLLSTDYCIEIIRLQNTLHRYDINQWDTISKDYLQIKLFLKHIDLNMEFGRTLNVFLLENGKAEISSGMGLYYSKYDIYSGGKILNDKSIYIIKIK